jgi:hypothetical protein
VQDGGGGLLFKCICNKKKRGYTDIMFKEKERDRRRKREKVYNA